MEIEFTRRAFKEWEEWKKSGNEKIIKRIAELTQAILQVRFQALVNLNPLSTNMPANGQGELTENIVTFMRCEVILYMSFP